MAHDASEQPAIVDPTSERPTSTAQSNTDDYASDGLLAPLPLHPAARPNEQLPALPSAIDGQPVPLNHLHGDEHQRPHYPTHPDDATTQTDSEAAVRADRTIDDLTELHLNLQPTQPESVLRPNPFAS
ncbi:hypothetical protein HDU88_002054 [Geranomyces variabilis]|nr:hypothetical protein HDU88_002054 [Geranomyces variabilis]